MSQVFLKNFWNNMFRLRHIRTIRAQDAAFYRTAPVLKKKEVELPDMNKPYSYTSSKAKDWRSVDSLTAPARDAPWYQPISVICSVAIFLIYFCILREENDIDLELGKTLYERTPGLEEKQLRLRIKYELESGDQQNIPALQARLKEVIAQRKGNE